MFDPSHGTNLGLELGADSMAIRFGQAMQNLTVPTIFAGGIGPDNVSGVVRLLNYYFEDFGIDTESGVRTNNELDLEKVKQYLIGFQEAVR